MAAACSSCCRGGLVSARSLIVRSNTRHKETLARHRYIFKRVDRLSNSDGQLDAADFANALMLTRDIILGGGPSDGLVSYEKGF